MLDPNILLQARPTNLMEAIDRGFSAGEKIRNAPMMRALAQQKMQQQKQQAEQEKTTFGQQQTTFGQQQTENAQSQESKKGAFAHRLATQLRQVPEDQRASVIQQNARAIQAFNVNPESFTDLSDQSLDNAIAATSVFAQPGKDGRTNNIKDFEYSQQNPDFLSHLKDTKKPLVSINNEAEAKGLTEEQKALAKSRVSRFEELQNVAQAAMDQMEQVNQLDSMDLSTGITEPIKVNMARVFNSFGVDGDKLINVDSANAQAFSAVSGRLLAEALAAQKGPQTDKDADRLMATFPRLSSEAEANKFLIGSMRAISLRKVEQAEFYENVLESEGTLKDADKKWREFKRKTPLSSDTIKNHDTGLPMFFNEFLEKAQEKNPDATRNEIIEVWRELNE
jgi:hypothetical protein